MEMIATNLVGAIVEPADSHASLSAQWPHPVERGTNALPRARVVAAFVAGMQDIELLLVDQQGRMFKALPLTLRVIDYAPTHRVPEDMRL